MLIHIFKLVNKQIVRIFHAAISETLRSSSVTPETDYRNQKPIYQRYELGKLGGNPRDRNSISIIENNSLNPNHSKNSDEFRAAA